MMRPVVVQSNLFYLKASPLPPAPLLSLQEKESQDKENNQKAMQNPSKIDQKSIQNRSKIDAKSRKSDFERSWRFQGKGPGLQERFLIDFGRQHGANLGPSWGQFGVKIDIQLH